jgi:hypothetical protein
MRISKDWEALKQICGPKSNQAFETKYHQKENNHHHIIFKQQLV